MCEGNFQAYLQIQVSEKKRKQVARNNDYKVVNDTGERGIALMNSINGFLTKDETELQNILQVVERHRNKHVDSNKSTLMAH
jgi:hypothetical protein